MTEVDSYMRCEVGHDHTVRWECRNADEVNKLDAALLEEYGDVFTASDSQPRSLTWKIDDHITADEVHTFGRGVLFGIRSCQ